jgi:hypothetical protein
VPPRSANPCAREEGLEATDPVISPAVIFQAALPEAGLLETRNAAMASVGDERERFGQELAGLQLELACELALEALADAAAEEDG